MARRDVIVGRCISSGRRARMAVGDAKGAVLSMPGAEPDDRRTEAEAERTAASLPPPPISTPPRSGGWGPIGTYWRGEYSLGVSFWVVGFVITALTFGVVFIVTLGISATTSYNPYNLLGITIFMWAVVFLVTLWKTVGLWRAARRHAGEQRARGRTAFWAVLVQCVVVLTVLTTAKDFVVAGIPELRDNYALAFQGDPTVADFAIRVMRDGTELEISGGFKYGLDAALREALTAAPNVKVVHLASTGGRIGEAMKVHQTIADHKLNTYVIDTCYSACTLAFAAGRERWLGEGGGLGFHSAAFPGWSLNDAEQANRQQRAIFIKDGFDPDFVRRALATPASTMLNPSPKELLAARAITGVAPRDMFAASGLGIGLTQEDFTQWLRQGSPLIAAVERGDPAAAEKIYGKYFSSYAKGATFDAMLSAISADISQQISKHKPMMDDETALAMGRLLIDQYRHIGLIDPRACYEYAKGITGTLPRGMMSEELTQRDRAIKVRIISSSTPPQVLPSEKLKEGWKAVTKALKAGPHAKYLDVFSRTPEPYEYSDYCAISITYYETILNQPTPLAAALMRDTVAR